MPTITTIGLDIAKLVFQVHGVDAARQAVTHGLGCLTAHAVKNARLLASAPFLAASALKYSVG